MPDKDHGPVTIDDLEGRNFALVWEAAALLRADPRTIRRAIAAGQIPATTVGKDYRIPVPWLLQQAMAAGGAA